MKTQVSKSGKLDKKNLICGASEYNYSECLYFVVLWCRQWLAWLCVSMNERVRAFILISSTIFPLLFGFFLCWALFSNRKCSINIYGLRFLFACRSYLCVMDHKSRHFHKNRLLFFLLRYNYYFCCFVISSNFPLFFFWAGFNSLFMPQTKTHTH